LAFGRIDRGKGIAGNFLELACEMRKKAEIAWNSRVFTGLLQLEIALARFISNFDNRWLNPWVGNLLY